MPAITKTMAGMVEKQGVKMTDQVTGRENAKYEIARHHIDVLAVRKGTNSALSNIVHTSIHRNL